MANEISLNTKVISRRTALGVKASIVAAPALAEECRVGPPPHEKGPSVFLDYDQVELDAAYFQPAYAPNFAQVLKRFTELHHYTPLISLTNNNPYESVY